MSGRSVEKAKACGALPFLTDTNTLYLGSRSNAVEHITTAILHGFDYAVAGAPIIIADGLDGKNKSTVNDQQETFQDRRHRRGHRNRRQHVRHQPFQGALVSGFGGAIKNLAMGCAPPEGKRAQHKAQPFIIDEQCIGCGDMHSVCPEIGDHYDREKISY